MQESQPKLAIGKADDPFEREADRIAEQVSSAPGHPDTTPTPPHIRRLSGQANADGAKAPASVERVLAESGRPLAREVGHDMEQRFDYDFSRVRVHADSLADRSAQDVNANAYTAGSHVVFAAGRYSPETDSGRRLLAHELAHVVQQSGHERASVSVQRDDKDKSKTAPPPKVVDPVAPNKDQKKMIDAARRAAAVRTQVAMFKASGIQGTGGFLEAKRLAQIKFDWADPNMEQIAEVLSGMGGGLVSVDVKVAGRGDPECGSRSGYVRGHRPPIVLCSGFFRDPADDEGRVRTMIHEMAHVKGIGSADVAEQYFPIFDCEQKGAFESADAWSNYVHCLSGQAPDKEEIQGNVGGAKKSAPKKIEGKK